MRSGSVVIEVIEMTVECVSALVLPFVFTRNASGQGLRVGCCERLKSLNRWESQPALSDASYDRLPFEVAP
jgi:hypothetical protein